MVRSQARDGIGGAGAGTGAGAGANMSRQQGRLVMDLLSHAGNEIMADILIATKDGGVLPASRFVLGARSTVLQKMLYTNSQARDSREIRLDYSTAVVRHLIHYCRSNEIMPCQSKDEAYSRALVELCDCGSTFQLYGLEDMVCESVKSLLDLAPHLACAVFDEAFSNEAVEALQEIALTVIREDPETTLMKRNGLHKNREPGVVFLGSVAISEILRDHRMCTEEIVMFQSLLLWAEFIPTASVHSGAKMHERRELARGFAERYIDLSCIAPSDLFGCVTNSGLVGLDKVSDGLHELALRLESEGANVSKRRAAVGDEPSLKIGNAPTLSYGRDKAGNLNPFRVADDDDGDDASILSAWVNYPQKDHPGRQCGRHESQSSRNGARIVTPQAQPKQKGARISMPSTPPKAKTQLVDVVDYFVGDGCCSHPRYKDPSPF